MHTLQNYLDASERGNPGNAAKWRDYLSWDELTIEALRPEGPRPAELQDLVKRLTGGWKRYTDAEKAGKTGGLERPEFVQVRERLQDLRRIAVIAATPGGPSPMTAIDGTADLSASYLSATAERPLVNASN